MELFGALGSLRRALPRYLGYQVVTKPLMAMLVVPLYLGATSLLLTNLADGAITNSNLVPFLLSWRGAGWLICGLLVLLAGFVLEIAGFVTIADRALRGEPPAGYRAILRHSASRVRNLAGPGSVVLVAYLLVILPLTGEAAVSPLAGVKIPSFVAAAIAGDGRLLAAYLGVLAVLTVLGALLAYTFHFLVLLDQPVGASITNSARLVLGQPRVFFTRFVGTMALIAVLAGVALTAWWVLVVTLGGVIGTETLGSHVALVFLLLLQQLGALGVAMVSVPVQVHVLTGAFRVAAARDPRFAPLLDTVPSLPARVARPAGRWGRWLRRPVVLVTIGVVSLALLAVPGGLLFNDIFRIPGTARVVAHRAGGSGAPENSLAGLEHAVGLGAWGVEVDVQRTRDGEYVLNHDDTFARVAGVASRSQDLTLAEVRRLDLSAGRDGSVRVPTLEEFLVAARGRVHVIVELKGATADPRMADDVVALVRRLGMLEQVVVMSLDPALVRHVEETSPEVETGYAFFWSLGDVARLPGDDVLLEEDQATTDRLLAVEAAGKRAMVWTVNSPDSISRLASAPVHAIITDEVAAVQAAVDRSGLTGAELVEDLFLGGG